MMVTKILEVRDRGTFFPVVCVDMNNVSASAEVPVVSSIVNERWEHRQYLLCRMGYPCDGKPNIAMAHARAGGDPFTNDPYFWSGSRTYPIAHNYIIDHWAELKDGDVIDVEFILGETTEQKISERLS